MPRSLVRTLDRLILIISNRLGCLDRYVPKHPCWWRLNSFVRKRGTE